MPTTVGQFCINVTDLERSTAFYEDIIGLKVQNHVEATGFREVVLAADEGGGRLQLAHHDDGPATIDHGDALWKFYFNVEDAAAVTERAAAAGHTVEKPAERLEQWPVTVAFLRDPDGYLVELLQRHPS
jgi:lactoylglutathione lyase